jgi:hypothetical protein
MGDILMAEYNGPRCLIDPEGKEHHFVEYVRWLEAQVASLEQQLSDANATISSLQSQNRLLKQMGSFSAHPRREPPSAYPRSARVHNDHDDYSDHLPYEDDDR